MKLQSTLLRNSLLFLAVILAWPVLRAAAQTPSKPDSSASLAQTPAVPVRITQAIDETQLVRLKGNVHPLARPEFDQGIVADATPMNRMLLLLRRSPEQQTALSQLMDEQLSKDSPNFHKWLTPQQFGAQFGPADADIQSVTQWLTSHGFHNIKVGAGRTTIEFSGNVSQVRSAFHTEIHRYLVNGDARQANTADPQIPAALTPVVSGIVSLHNFPMKSMRRVVGQFSHTMAKGETTPLFTTSGGNYALGPADFAKIYNIPASLDGTGANIAIIGFSTIAVTDAHDFRALFGLPVNDPIIVNNGPDPGFSGEEGEADLDTQWSGAVAPKATIHYVLSEGTLTSDPLFLGAEYVIDNNTDDVMSLSFGNCEAALGTASNNFFLALWEQAAAQGITVTVSAGDGGTAGCDDFNSPSPATLGLAVSGIASTPFNIAVGGTDFDDVGTQISGGFWSATNSTDGKRESALGYIHEVPWNDSCAATATPTNLTTCAVANNIVAGSGGPSSIYAKPLWQNGIIPNGIAAGDNHRYLPDISLFASDGLQSKSFYVICEADGIPAGNPPSCVPDATGHFSFFGVGGTSASAPSFAGIIALIGQSESNAGRSRRQGNANQVLYKLAQTATNSCDSSAQPLAPPAACLFYKTTKGNNSVPCAGASPNCSSTTANTNGVLVTTSGATKTPAFTAAPGSASIPSYNLATGLGTVNVANLATAWGTAEVGFKPTTTALKINGSSAPGTIAHGTPVTAAVTVAVVSPATGTPTGDFSILPPNATANAGPASNQGTLSGSPTTLTGVLLPGGSYSVTAHYAGDGTFAPSDSAGVPITVTKENSRTQLEIVTFDPITGNVSNTNATTFSYGSPYILRMEVLDHTTNACTVGVTTLGCAFDATGTITLTDNTAPLDGGSFKLNSEGHVEDQPIQLTGGMHTLSASYSGDSSYNPSGPVNDVVTVTKATTTASVVSSAPTVASGTPLTLTATVIGPTSSGAGPTGTVVFSANSTAISGTPTITSVGFNPNTGAPPTMTATLTATFTTAGTESITAAYSGDTNYSASNATAINVTVTSTGSFTVSYNPSTVALSSASGANAMTSVTVTPSGGFTGMVTVICPTGAGLPPGVTCTPPAPINITSASPVAANITLAVTATSTTLTASAAPAERNIYAAGLAPTNIGKGWWGLSAVTGLGALILLLLPGRKRYRLALGLGLVCMLTFSLGCNNYKSGGGGGPVPTTTHISVPAPGRVASGSTFTFTATVTGGAPTDNVQLFDSGVAIGTAVAVSGGTATLVSPALSVGTHSISAHYAGDAYNTMASQSGTLNVTVTGNASLAITTNPTATPAAPALNVTIN